MRNPRHRAHVHSQRLIIQGAHAVHQPDRYATRKYVGIDQSSEYVEYARKRLEHALEQKASSNRSPAAIVLDVNRQSRVMTKTDAFGRARVPRTRAGRSVKPISEAG